MNNPENIAYIKARMGNKWWRLNNLYKIENEDGQLVTFKLRPAQVLLFKMMGRKNIILKARQLGFSSAIDIYLLDEALWHKNLKCGIIAQDQSAAGEIFRTKIEIPFDNLPIWLKAEFPIESRRSGANGGYILFKNGSSIQCATSFRSGTVQRLHISEHGKICAKYPQKAKEVKTGTLNTIHQKAICFIESTAEGVGGDFYLMCVRSLDLLNSGEVIGDMDYRFHFFAWFQDPKYASSVPSKGLQLSKYYQEYFAAIEAVMNVKLTDEQKQWYINKEIEQGEEIKQEFPSTPQEAFLTSGRRVFDAIKVMNAEAYSCKPLIIYDIEPVTGKKIKVQAMRNAENELLQRSLLNMLLVWELPDIDEEYAIGVDIAEGLEHNDRSSFDVVKKSTGEQVAHWFGYIDTELFASLVRHVGLMYNTAFVGPERNNHGHAFIQAFRVIYPIRRIYQEQYIDRDNDNDTPKLGWLTTKQSKPIIIEGLKELLRTITSGIRWIGTISELNSYVYDAKGSMNAQAGCFDDQVMSYAIAQEMRARMPITPKYKQNNSRASNHWMTK
ncbi:terminase [Photobacterium damselae]|uniref:terminase n=1 Tax=Photobacterium damselae TaxID=38293 RepID=UPI000D664C8D|nr:terminase [Photobacterium damselae]AWK83834.1 terminase [Photobacterium damselae]